MSIRLSSVERERDAVRAVSPPNQYCTVLYRTVLNRSVLYYTHYPVLWHWAQYCKELSTQSLNTSFILLLQIVAVERQRANDMERVAESARAQTAATDVQLQRWKTNKKYDLLGDPGKEKI